MYCNLEIEQVSKGYTDEHIAEKLGMTQEAYCSCKVSGAFSPSEIVALVEIYGKSMDYLFQSKA